MSDRGRAGVVAPRVVRGSEWDGRDRRSDLLGADGRRDRGAVRARTRAAAAPPAPGAHRASLSGPAAPGPPAARGWFVGEGPNVRGRALWLMLSFAALAILLLVHLFQVQVGEHAVLSAAAAAEDNIDFTLTAQRGDVLDSDGQVLVGAVTTWDVHVDPTQIDAADRDSDAAQIAAVLRVSESQVLQALEEPNTQYAFLADNVSQSVDNQLAQLKIGGIILQEQDMPVYEPSAVPGESFAANLLGFVNASGQGQYGVEGYYNQLLSGQNGTASEIKDSQGNAIYLNRAQRVPAQDGDNLELGLNSQIQYWAEQAIANAVNKDSAQSGQILVMNTHTGAIQAWADYPSYDATDFSSTPLADFADPAIDGELEPGSVMKTVTFAGALQNGVINPGYTFDEGPTTIDGVTIQDWDHEAHGNITMQTVLDESLNNGAIKAEQLEGADAFYANMLAFGIGAPTGVDLAGEANQEMAPQSSLSPLDYAEMSFGQSVAVTPVEMLAAVNAIANGGVWVEPHAVTSIIDPNTGTTTQVVPTTRQVISAATASTLTTMMTHVVDDSGGEGFDARIPGWSGEVAGKTGTAQEPIDGQLTGTDVSFVGFLPASDPQFTMMVVLDEPQVPAADDFGSLLAAPVWRQMAEQMIDYERLTP
jgi:stage V sporulation protein D (sporulation-specific penicillin-binding protein)